MPEYAKMKNADLEALLKERGLPHAGKKADMVDRLTKDDEKSGSSAAPAETKSAVNAEDEIDWDDEEPAKDAPAAAEEVTTNAETVEKAGGEGQPPNPQAVPNQVADIDPAKTDDLSVQAPAESTEAQTEETKAPAPDYAQGLAATNIDDEIERRKKRALKFGTKIEDDEGLKKLERMKKFGEKGQVQGLDEALPERQERNQKRGREDKDDAGANKRRDGGRPGRGGRGGGRRDNRDENRNERRRRDSRSPRRERAPRAAPSYNDQDKAAAEARKARFAKPTA